MTNVVLRRPEPGEYNAYYETYVGKIHETDVIAALAAGRDSTLALLEKLPAAKVDYRYAPEKWTIRQVLGHVLDMEWVFAARAFHFARAVPGELPGVDQDDTMKVVDFTATPWPALLDQYRHLRSANIQFFNSLDEPAWSRKGIASGHPVTVRGLAYIIAGHERHHMGVVRERYL
jgi:uncharacterized damage-inducible protein DinB